VYTVFVRNITFSADESAIDRAREVARGEHKTLNDAFREWLSQYGSRSVTAEEIAELYRGLRHVRAGRKFTRDEMNERR
jgi:predicted transcriptional regulator